MKLLLRVLLTIGLGLLALVAFVALAYRPEPLPEGSLSAQRLLPGPFTVLDYQARFVDSTRATPANGDFAGSAERVLEGQVWYPAEGRDAPLLIFSHGFTSTYRNGRYLAEHLASHGFVVVAVDYPLTAMSAPGGPNVADVVSQPGDVSFLIDTLGAYSAQTGHPLHGRLDAARIGVFGISLGGLTSTLAGYHRDWRDPRIDAVLSIAGPTEYFTPAFFADSDVPFLMLAGALDALVPYEFNAAPVPDKVRGAELVTIEGGSHTAFSGATAYFKWMENTDALGCWAVQRNIDAENAKTGWDQLLGGPEIGIDYRVPNRLCEVDPLPPAMNVLRQQMLAQLVIRAFFEKTLLADAARRQRAETFLAEQLPAELDEVRYRRSPR